MPPFSGGRSANFVRDFSIPEKPLSRYFCSTSSTVTSNPAVAETCAIPDPISPQPRTPTFFMFISVLTHHAYPIQPIHVANPSEPLQQREERRICSPVFA